jgi:hypothetical protein
MSDDKQTHLLNLKKNLNSIKESDKIREIIFNVAISSENYCLKKCDIGVSKRLFNPEEGLNAKEFKLAKMKPEKKENCYKVCVYKFFQSSIQAVLLAQKINQQY